MMLETSILPPSIVLLQRVLAETLVRSRLDYRGDIRVLEKFLEQRDLPMGKKVTAFELSAMWEAQIKAWSKSDHYFSAYLHIPYCTQKCHFCFYTGNVTINQDSMDRYLLDLKKEIKFYAHLWRGVPILSSHVGGGTPNMLSSAQLREILGALISSFEWRKESIHNIEFNPAHTTMEKLEIARSYGFNRVSFGVQSFNSFALEKEGREYQSDEMTTNAVAWARRAGFEIINVDLMLGLVHDTLDGFLGSVRRTLELEPSSILIPKLTFTDAYLKEMNITQDENSRRYGEFLPKAIDGMRKICEGYGYEMTYIVADRWWLLYRRGGPKLLIEDIQSRQRFAQGENFSVLGLGQYAHSSLFGRAMYDRIPKDFDPTQPIYQMTPITLQEEMIRYVLYNLDQYSRLNFQQFANRFGADICREFALGLKALKYLGKIKINKNGIDFLPVRNQERIFYGLFLLIDIIAGSQLSHGLLDKDLIKKLNEDLACVNVREETRCSL